MRHAILNSLNHFSTIFFCKSNEFTTGIVYACGSYKNLIKDSSIHYMEMVER
jgi:hypothetical protein